MAVMTSRFADGLAVDSDLVGAAERAVNQALSRLSGQADLVCLGRGMLFNPRWPWHAARDLGEEVFYPPQYERSHPSMRRGDFLKPRRA